MACRRVNSRGFAGKEKRARRSQDSRNLASAAPE
jgi:hypothetical protein